MTPPSTNPSVPGMAPTMAQPPTVPVDQYIGAITAPKPPVIRHPKEQRVRNPFKYLAWPVSLLMILLLMPPETSVSLGALRLSPYRLLLMVGVLMALARLMSGRCGRLIPTDWLVFAHCLWVLVSLFKYGGVITALESGGIYGVEATGAYLLARVYIRSAVDYQAMIKLHLLLVIALAIAAIPESLTGVHYIRDAFRMVLGGSPPHFMDPRLGLERAFGPFEHPILMGVFCASALSGAILVLGKGKVSLGNIKRAGLVGIAAMTTVSGGPIVAYVLQAGLLGWEYVTRAIRGRWQIALAGFAFVYVAIDMLSNRTPILVFVQYLTFSPHSAYNRVNIWNYGTAEIARHPIMGIGLAEWERASWMSPSVDNFWLLTAMRYGLPALILLLAALGALMWSLCRKQTSDPVYQRCRLAWAITLISLSVVGLTVHFWNAIFVMFFFLIGSGAWMATVPSQRHPTPDKRGRS